MNAAWNCENIKSTEKFVLLALADWSNDNGLCWPSINTIAKKCSLTGRTVQNAINKLEEKNLLKREIIVGKGTKYWLTISENVTHEKNSPVNNIRGSGELNSPNTKETLQSKYSLGRSTKIDWPDWLPFEAWIGFINMRKAIKKPMTERSVNNMLNKLEKMRNKGQDIEAVLDQSINSCWADVYEVKGKNNGKNKRTLANTDKRDGFTKALDGNINYGGNT